MDRLHAAWRTIAGSRRNSVVAAGVFIAALSVGAGVAIGVGALRSEADVTAGASATAVPTDSPSLTPSASPRGTFPSGPMVAASPSLGATPGPAATATPQPAPTVAVTPEPTPTPTPLESEPAVAAPTRLDLAATTLIEGVAIRSRPGTEDPSTVYEPHLPLGTGMRLVEGPVLADDHWWYRVADLSVSLDGGVDEGWVAAADADGTAWIAPTAAGCGTHVFALADITVASLAELTSGMEATWFGCVTTPWIAPYSVVVTFRDDATYSARTIDGALEPAFYYGTDEDRPNKRYAMNDLQDNLKGIGEIEIVFDDGGTNRGELRNVALMGNQLAFEFFHRGDYGPVTFQLYRSGR